MEPAALDNFADLDWGRPARIGGLSADHILSGSLGGFSAVTDLAVCLLPLLTALEWEGDPRHVAEALPHFADSLDLTDFLNVMANLGYSSRSLPVALNEIDPRLLPCLYLPEHGLAMVVLARTAGGLHVFDAAARGYRTIGAPAGRGSIHVFKSDIADRGVPDSAARSYVHSILDRFRPLIMRALGTSLFASLLVLATPMFIMGVYDKVIGTGAVKTLLFMLIGAAVALIGDFALRRVRAGMMAHLGARLDYILGRAVFHRLVFLAPNYTEMANISAQVARLKDFEVIREFLTGPVVVTLLEIPFTLVFLLVMAIIGGPLVFVPLGALVLSLTVGSFAYRRMRSSVAEASRAASRKQEFLVETLSKLRDVKNTAAEDVWIDRFRELSADAAVKGYRASQVSAVVTALTQAVIVCTGLVTLGWGVLRVLDGHATVGALIACMIMVWWVLRPLQVVYATLGQIERVRDAVSQIDRLMQIRPERHQGGVARPAPILVGRVALAGVSMRYLPDADPAVVGVSLQVEPGESVGIIGPNGSGKSTLLRLILGMHRPQAGSVRIDGVDIRQIDPVELRRSIAYVPPVCEIFFGTIAQNLRLAQPTATDRELRWACAEAGLLDDVDALSEGFETRLGDGHTDRLPANMLQRLSLARAYLKRAPITLLDEPASNLDFDGDQQFMKVLQRMNGHSTIFLVTHRPSHLRLVDKLVVLSQGQVRMAGPARQVLERLPQGFI